MVWKRNRHPYINIYKKFPLQYLVRKVCTRSVKGESGRTVAAVGAVRVDALAAHAQLGVQHALVHVATCRTVQLLNQILSFRKMNHDKS